MFISNETLHFPLELSLYTHSVEVLVQNDTNDHKEIHNSCLNSAVSAITMPTKKSCMMIAEDYFIEMSHHNLHIQGKRSYYYCAEVSNF